MLYFLILQWLQARQNVEDASKRPILSATCVGTSQQLHSVEPSLPSSEPPTLTIDRKIGDQDKSSAPHICCKPCYNGLTAWFNGKKAAFNFAVPMVWREPRNHADDCYFCLTNITGFNASSRKKIKYPNLRSAIRPVPHSDDLPVPTPPVNKDLLSSSDEEMPSREDSAESIPLEDLDHTRRPEWSCLWIVSVKTAVRALGFSAWTVEPSPGRCKDHQFQESEQIRSLVFLWVCKRASQSTVVFSVSGDSRAVSQHYKQKDWGSRSTFVPGEHSLKKNPLVDMNKVLLPPLHIKFGLMKNFVKVLHKNGAAFQHVSTVFPGLSAAKLKEGIFVGPQIREVLKDTDFEELLNLKELRAWEAFKSVCSGFLGNTRVPDYQAYIEKLLKSYEDMGCRILLKFHFLHSHLNFSRQTLEQWVMSMEKDSTKALRRWRVTIKANGTPAWWETSAGCSCVTSRRQNTPDLRKHTLTVCGTVNCVIVSSKYIDSISVLYLSCFICYKLLQLLKYAHIFSVYTKMRLFKSQKTRGDRAKLFINLNSAHQNKQKKKKHISPFLS